MLSFKITKLVTLFKRISKYFFELLVVVFGVYLGFAANSYSEEQKQKEYVKATIKQMYIGLQQDLDDAEGNRKRHEGGIACARFISKIVKNQDVNIDSFEFVLFNLTRSFVSVQNTSPFETLKSKGLNLITNDSLRSRIIKLYDFQYDVLEKIEETYDESRLFENYNSDIVQILDKSLVYDQNARLEKIILPLNVTPEERSRLILILKRIINTRYFNINVYDEVIGDMKLLIVSLQNEYPFLKE